MSNDILLLETAATVRAFADGQVSFDELQAKLQSAMALLERTDDAEVATVIGNIESDLELIRFTVFGDEVHPSVRAALEPLLPLLPHLPEVESE